MIHIIKTDETPTERVFTELRSFLGIFMSKNWVKFIKSFEKFETNSSEF